VLPPVPCRWSVASLPLVTLPPSPYRGLPPHVQTASFWLDDSGSRGQAHRGFVIGGIKTRHSDLLQRAIHGVRDKHGHAGELKFANVNERNMPRYRALVDVLRDSDVHIVASVLNTDGWNPFKGQEHWIGQTAIVADIVASCLNRNEVASVYMDGISTPLNVALGELVKRHSNGRLQGHRVTAAVSLDSRSNDVLQAADLIAGAIRYLRFETPRDGSPKLELALYVCSAFGVLDFSDRSSQRIRIKTLSAPPGKI
jgi:hypothetical protein